MPLLYFIFFKMSCTKLFIFQIIYTHVWQKLLVYLSQRTIFYFILFWPSINLYQYLFQSFRCLFDINRLVSENNLTLVGATWFRSTTDDYVYYRQIARSPRQEGTICKRAYSKYIDSTCPIAGTAVILPSIISIFVFVLIANLFTYTQQ